MRNLNPKTQLTIKLDKARVSRIAKENDMTSRQLIQLIEPILRETLEKTTQDIMLWIIKYVPKRTGQLRMTLLKSLQKSKVQRGILRFIMGTHLDYAKKVNAMSTAQVRHNSHREHSGKWAYAYYYTHRNRGPKVGKRRRIIGKKYKGPSNYRIFLYDPEAIGGFWEALIRYLKERAMFHMKNAMLLQYGKTKLPWVIN